MNRLEFPRQSSIPNLAWAHERFLRDGVLDTDVTNTVRQSWLRCRAKGIDPRSFARQRTLEAFDAARTSAGSLIQAAERPLEILHGALREEPHLVVLSDANGVLVRVIASQSELEAGRHFNMFEGASWGEADIGTNGIGTAIVAQAPVLIVGPQHYSDVYASWTCIGVPIRTLDGSLVGVVDLSFRGAPVSRYALDQGALARYADLMASIAEAVEAELRRFRSVQIINADQVGTLEDPIKAIHSVFDALVGDFTNPYLDVHLVEDMRYRLREAEKRTRDTILGLSESRAQLEEWDRRKDEAFANLAHELKNPINVVVMLIELMERKSIDSSRLGEIAPRLRHQAQRLARLIGDINDIARLKRGTLIFQQDTVDINKLIQTSLEGIVRDVEEKSQKVSVRLSPAPLIVSGDSGRFGKIFTNILTNATKYTPRGGRIIVQSEAADGNAVIRIRDNGCGISPENLERIFDEFSRVIPSSGDPGGMGIGLALVKKLVRLHRGTVTARSEGPGRGSEFEVRLPLKAA